MTSDQLHILQHSLGLDNYGQGEMYRNHFCAGGGHATAYQQLVAMGCMETFTRGYLPYYNFTVPEAGKAAVLAESPKSPKMTRSQQQYREFLQQFRFVNGRGLLSQEVQRETDRPMHIARSSRTFQASYPVCGVNLVPMVRHSCSRPAPEPRAKVTPSVKASDLRVPPRRGSVPAQGKEYQMSCSAHAAAGQTEGSR